MYYSQEGEEIKEQKSARNFNITEKTFMYKIGENGLFFKDFETFNNNVLLKIEFLEKLQEMDETKKYTYNELYKYFSNEDKIEIENCKVMAEFEERDIDENGLLQKIIMYNRNRYGQLSIEMLEDYKSFISNIESLEDYREKMMEKSSHLLEQNAEITWIVDYFSGCLNEKYIKGYDMPSLAIFDTDCLDILSQRKEKIFDAREKDNEQILTSEYIGSELAKISREGLTDSVQTDLITMVEVNERRFMMISYEYSVAFSETLDILNHTKKEDIEKIPIKFLEFLRTNALKTYESKLDFSKPIKDMNLNKKTIGILSIIYKKYWCNAEQREVFEEKLKHNEIAYQKKLSEEYSTEKLFKNRELEKAINTDVTDLITYEEPKWYKKIFEKILHFFSKK